MISVIVAAAAFTPPSLRASAPGMSAASKSLPPAQQRSFRRAKLLDIFESVSEKEIVNVLGRWSTYAQVTLPPPPAQPREQQRNLVADTPGAGVR